MIKFNNELGLFLFLVISSFWIGCGAGVNDTSENLGDGYTYRSEGSTAWISPGGSVYEDGVFPNILDYSYNSDFIIAVQEPSAKDYKVYLVDNLITRFGLMLYKPDTIKDIDVHQIKFLTSKWWKDTSFRNKIAKEILPNHFANYNNVDLIVDSFIRNDPYHQRIFSSKRNYWILNKKTNELFGPFSKGEYLSKKIVLGIPKEFMFEEN